MAKTSAATKRQTSTTNVIVISVLVSILSLALAGYIAKNLIASIQLNAKIMSKKTAAANTLKSNLEAAPKLVQAYNDQGEDRHSLVEHSLPSDDDYAGLIALIERVGGVSAMSVRSIAPGGTAATTTPTTPTAAPATSSSNGATTPQPFAFSANMTGSYAAAKALLQNLELSARPMKVTQISLSGTSSNLTAQVGLTTWYEEAASLELGKETVK